MDNRPLWVIKIDDALGRILDTYHEVEAALGRVRGCYSEIAVTINDAMRDDPTLEQAMVAEAIGKSPAWVSRTLKWYREGCKSESPFGEEIAARRKAAKLENTIATSQSEEQMTVSSEDMGQLWLYDEQHGGCSDHVQGRAAATLKALGLLAACQALTKAANGLRRKTLVLVRPSDHNKSLFTLTKLAAELEQLISASDSALIEVRAALKKKPRLLEAAE
jgi:hypothetical protein